MFDENNKVSFIRISKKYSLKENKINNLILVSRGSNKIQINLSNNKISRRQIVESLNTIHNVPMLEEDEHLYYTSIKNNNSNKYYQITSNENEKLAISKRRKNFLSSKKKNKTINLKKPNIPDIYNLSSENNKISKKYKIYKSNDKNKNFADFSQMTQKESHNRLIRKAFYSGYKNNEINNINFNKTENINDNKINNSIYKKNNNHHQIISYNDSKNVIARNNSQNINYISIEVQNNNNDKISGLINIKNDVKIYENKKDINNICFFDNNYKNNNDRNCIICEKTYLLKHIYFSKCNRHFFCKNCLKIYCEDLIDKGVKKMKCPIFNCGFDIDENYLKNILNIEYFQILCENKNQKIDNKDNKSSSEESKFNNFNNKKYTSKNLLKSAEYKYPNVLDINSNYNLYTFRKHKDEFCPKCHERSLFKKTNSYFYKCLNCSYKMCKYCNKEFTNNHFTMNDQNHCKVFYRKSKRPISKNNILNYLFQIFYIIAMFFLLIVFCFLSVKSRLLSIFRIKKRANSDSSFFIKTIYCISYILSFLVCLIVLPFFIIIIPFFPVIIALIDGY